MLTLERTRPTAPIDTRWATYLLLFVGMVFMASHPGTGTSEGAQNPGGCDGLMGAKLGLLGLAGGGSIVRQVVKHGDDIGRLAAHGGDEVLGLARHGDEVVDLARHGDEAADLLRHADELGRGLDATIGMRKAGAALDNQWQEATGIIGRMATEGGLDLSKLKPLANHPDAVGLKGAELAKYADANPGFWEDLGVALYLDDPHLWKRLGGDNLLAMTAVRSPQLRKLVRADATHRMAGALNGLKGLGPADVATAEQQLSLMHKIQQQHGLSASLTEEGVALTMKGPDYAYQLSRIAFRNLDRVHDYLTDEDQMRERPVSYRAKFDEREATQQLRNHLDRYVVVREQRIDVAGLYAFRDKQEVDGKLRVFWVGPDVLLNSGEPDDFDRLVALLDDGQTPVDARAYATLWVSFHQPLFSSLCTEERPEVMDLIEPDVVDPTVARLDGLDTYHFYWRSSGNPCQLQEVGRAQVAAE